MIYQISVFLNFNDASMKTTEKSGVVIGRKRRIVTQSQGPETCGLRKI